MNVTRILLGCVALLTCFEALAAGGAESPSGSFKDCRRCPEMTALPSGTLPNGLSIESFAIGTFEVTQAEWFAVMGTRPSEFSGGRLPVETVSWNEAQEFAKRLSARTGQPYRLPTEAEWEYAARAGSTASYAFGDDVTELDQHAWYIDNAAEKTHPVGQKLPNRFGLYDVHGNVWEWTQDCAREASKREGIDDTVAKNIRDCHRSYRGGSMANKASSLALSFFQSGGVGDRYFAMGFRIARSLH